MTFLFAAALRRTAAGFACVAFGLGAAATAAHPLMEAAHDEPRQPVKVMIVSMFKPEGQVWLDKLGPWHAIPVVGLSQDYPEVHCNRRGVCVVTTGMGHANAAASIMALALSDRFDLRRTYFLIAGIAGINPLRGTIGSAAWAKYLVDFGMQWEIDARDIPPGWKSGFLGIHTRNGNEKPPLNYRTEVFALNPRLADAAYGLSRDVTLADSALAQAARAKFSAAPADRPPAVIECDTLSDDTWWSGKAIGERASQWTTLLTDGKGDYCTTQQEDNATYEALIRASNAHLVDLNRVATLRTGSDFDRPYPGQSNADNLLDANQQGGFPLAIDNLYRSGNPLVEAISTHWDQWRNGVPSGVGN